MIFNLEAKIQSYKFYEAEISSFKRFTYHEIQDYKIDNSEICQSIESLKELTNKLLENKLKRNALEIESTEPVISIDKMEAF
jgi:exoribonuclease R